MPLDEQAVNSGSQDATSLDPEKNTPESTSEEPKAESEYLTGLKLGLVVLGLCLAVLLVGLVPLTTDAS